MQELNSLNINTATVAKINFIGFGGGSTTVRSSYSERDLKLFQNYEEVSNKTNIGPPPVLSNDSQQWVQAIINSTPALTHMTLASICDLLSVEYYNTTDMEKMSFVCRENLYKLSHNNETINESTKSLPSALKFLGIVPTIGRLGKENVDTPIEEASILVKPKAIMVCRGSVAGPLVGLAIVLLNGIDEYTTSWVGKKSDLCSRWNITEGRNINKIVISLGSKSIQGIQFFLDTGESSPYFAYFGVKVGYSDQISIYGRIIGIKGTAGVTI